jgi:hypothetical protein
MIIISTITLAISLSNQADAHKGVLISDKALSRMNLMA